MPADLPAAGEAGFDPDKTDEAASAAFDRGDLDEALSHLEILAQHYPDAPSLQYRLGLVHKYRFAWQESLAHNLRAGELSEEFDEAIAWNTGIAATALSDWPEARRQWALCGMEMPGEDGPIDTDFGITAIRLNAWTGGEVLFARRIDPVRARILNVPLPESGYAFGDIVLHDGAPTGERTVRGGNVHVFNALGRWQVSDLRTWTAFVTCDTPADAQALTEATGPDVEAVQDWTASIRHICLRCSYGLPHSHDNDDEDESAWERQRTVGIAARSRTAAQGLLTRWQSAGTGRIVDGLETRDGAIPVCPDNTPWWSGPDDTGDAQDA